MSYCKPQLTDRKGIFKCSVCGLENPRPIQIPFISLCGNSTQQVTKKAEPITEGELAVFVNSQSGPGTELYKILKKPVKVLSFVFQVTLGCEGTCRAYAIQMNLWGTVICREKIEEIIDRLQTQAKSIGLPFNRSLGKLAVLRAIREAEKKEKQIDISSKDVI